MIAVLNESVVTGLIFALLSMGVMITFKILDFPDMSVEGTFTLGAFSFSEALTLGVPAELAMLVAFAAGALGGFLTYILYRKFHIPAILAGILTMTFLYSVNLRITGTANLTLFEFETIFERWAVVPKLLLLSIVAVLVKAALDWYLKTERGYLLLATGNNERLVKALGKNPDRYVAIGLMLSNALAALAGSLLAQSNAYADITMGQSIIVSALASITIGDAFLKGWTGLKRTTRAIIGAVIYRLIYGLALYVGLAPSDLKAVTAVIVVVFILYNHASDGLRRSKQKRGAYANNQ